MATALKTIVLIPHYNNLDGLKKSLSCVFHPVGIDILVVDDGSNAKNKPSLSALKSELNARVNLKVIHLFENKGITGALNYGLNTILEEDSHEFIARIDCGDTCVKNRFLLQEKYMDEHPDTSLVGSWVKWVNNSSGKALFSYKPPSDNNRIKKKMSIRCNVIHPASLFRLSIVKKIGVYPVDYAAAEDYAYFFKMAKYSKVANIPKFLTQAEHNKDGISRKNKKIQSKSKLEIVMKYGRKDFYLLYGILVNLILMYTPSKLVFKIKSQIR